MIKQMLSLSSLFVGISLSLLFVEISAPVLNTYPAISLQINWQHRVLSNREPQCPPLRTVVILLCCWHIYAMLYLD
jgi:hypothetical protein